MLASILSSVELWAGLGLLLLVILLVNGRGASSKKMSHRMARVTRKKAPGVAASDFTQSLRRRDPSSETAIGQMLASMQSISKLKARLEIAGLTTTPQKFLSVMAGIMLGVFFFVGFLLNKPLGLALLLGVLLGLGLPHMYVSRKIRKRHKAFLSQFADSLELMVRGLRAGLPIAESFNTVAQEMPAPIGDTFARISQQTALGVPTEKALSDAALRLKITEFNFFVTSVILQRETGGNLGEILSNLADMLRQRNMMKLKIGALSSEARASAYIVGALPFFVMGMLELLSPDYLRPLFNDYRGNEALGAAALSMGLGGFIMGQMTQLEI